MSMEDMIYIKDWGEECAVCGKDVTGNRGFAHIRWEGKMIALCCPLCVETFHRNPRAYTFRREARELVHAAQPKDVSQN